MREQLIQYVDLLFAGAADSGEIKQEILQNTLDRFDDLVAQGKSPEAAYRLAITGIGDISEILGTVPAAKDHPQFEPIQEIPQETEEDINRRKIKGAAIAMYILSALPLIALSELGVATLGLCLTLAMTACATYLLIITGKDTKDAADKKKETAPKHPFKARIGNIIWIVGLILYFGLSFLSGAWHITWLLFPIMACARGLSDAIIDLMEANNHES